MECVPTQSFVSPLKGFLILPPATYEKKSGDMGCKLDDKPRLYVIGNMKRVNQKIAQLELGLKRFDSSDVVIENLELKRHPTPKGAKKGPKHGRVKVAERDQKTMQKVTVQTSDLDVVHHGKIVPKKFVSEKDKLVELYQYPGYSEQELTSLPNGIELNEILEKVIRAQRKTAIGKTHWSVKMLRKFLHAPCTQAILLDSFWWLFLHLYHPNREIQGCLFERIAENYSRTVLGCHRVSSQEDILKHFPSLLSQTVYTCFCYCFSRSWFNTYEFKAQLCDIFFEWLGGTLYAPGGFNKWDYSQLEPERSRREDLLSGKEQLRPDANVTFKTHKTSPSVRPLSRRHKKNISAKKAVNKAMTPASRKKRSQQPSPKEKVHLPGQSYSELYADKSKQGGHGSWNKPRSTPEKKLKVALLPRESHPACGGPEFTWHYLNIYGHSPLIQHFLQKRRADLKAGCDMFMPRREICKPIPDSVQTYADVVKEAFQNLHRRHKTFTRTYWKNWREMRNFDQQCLESQELFRQEMQEEMNRRMAQKKQELLPICSDRPKNSDKISSPLSSWRLPKEPHLTV
ncbi:protein FAM227A [Tiliqua scincoides]|uniref:protein FAM227A n=1 Tax=Tiliqua scincoides TaxID=71010 RepID=UPI0034626834